MNDSVADLIVAGLDRDAAARAIREHEVLGAKGETVALGPVEQLDVVIPLMDRVAGGADLDAPTPCDGWTVRDVFAHMTEGARQFTAAFGGDAPPPSNDEPVARLRAALGSFHDAVRAPGALDKDVDSPFGVMPGEQFARLAALDGLIHVWDVSTATNQPVTVPADVVAAADQFARVAITPALRRPGVFGPTVDPPAGCSPLEALAAFTGRRP